MSIQCPWCEEGKINKSMWPKEHPGHEDIYDPCPHCVNGEITLAVVCGCKSGIRGPKCYDYHVPSELRPLTDEEEPNCKVKGVSSLVPLKEFIEYVEQGLVTYNGLRVAIKKGE